MPSGPIRPSVLISLALASIYILSLYVSICSLASCFIYYTHIDIASVLVLIVYLFKYLIIFRIKISERIKDKRAYSVEVLIILMRIRRLTRKVLQHALNPLAFLIFLVFLGMPLLFQL